ncbi:unnamed protein product [Arctia plantaginis]|uniref:Uncharacterized protein n=1 Tax=Arctia plantaginis TaxID=874455 RepID=A0A8S1AWT3_ARCPL|nr:unnamed protein product [Arctia plantaginis]
MSSAYNSKYKRPKQKTTKTTNPGSSRPSNESSVHGKQTREPLCPLLAKDSEWVDNTLQPLTESPRTSDGSIEEEVLQLVDCEDGPQMKPLAIMFPDLLKKDPQTLQGVLNRVMSTTEVTRHLVDLGQKANFTFMKKADRLIPPDKQWMESLPENSSSYYSVNSAVVSNNVSSEYEAGCEITETVKLKILTKKKLNSGNVNEQQQESSSRNVKEKDCNEKSNP